MENRYCLQMVSCDGCGTGNVYSTEETVCGTWIDGKPIYRKVISGKLANESGTAYVFANVSELKVDQMINMYGKMIDKNNITQAMLQTSYNRPNGLFCAVNMYYGIETGNIFYHFIDGDKAYPGSTAYVVIEYTKK